MKLNVDALGVYFGDRSFTGARIETAVRLNVSVLVADRSFTGARIETLFIVRFGCPAAIAPSRERGLKQHITAHPNHAPASLLHGSAD